MGQKDFQLLLRFFKALGNESRLKILGILANQECSVEELATLLNIKEPTVSHHLARLKRLNLVTMETDGNTHYYSLNPDGLQAINKDFFTQEQMATLADDIAFDDWEQKVLGNFFEGERLLQIPASRKKRLVVLKWLAGQFEMGVRYPEKAVNEVIRRHHPDCATIRREFIASNLMARKRGIYWRSE
jgi:DNA-binding transcriptional ArsR family regulator